MVALNNFENITYCIQLVTDNPNDSFSRVVIITIRKTLIHRGTGSFGLSATNSEFERFDGNKYYLFFANH